MSPSLPHYSVLDVLGPRKAEDVPAPDNRVERATVDCAVYLDGQRLPGSWNHTDALQRVRELKASGAAAFLWLGLHEPNDQQMETVAKAFDLHPIAVEDAVHAHQRPKVERFDNSIFFVLRTVDYRPQAPSETARRIADTGEIMVFVGADFVIVVRHGDHSGLDSLRSAVESDHPQIALGPYGVLEEVSRHVVEHYLKVAVALERDIDAAEEDTFSPHTATNVEKIYLLKRDVVELRRAIGPLTYALKEMTSDHADLLPRQVRQYLLDVLTTQEEAADYVTGYDEMLTDLIRAALARNQVQQNADMRKISAWVAIAAVPTMIGAVYGMNFEYMPELQWHWGYYAALSLMVLFCITLYVTFRRNDWL